MRIRVVIADDHAIMRRAMQRLLEREDDIVVVGEATDGHEALNLVRGQGPDVLVTDIAMPGMNGLELIRAVARPEAKTKLLAVSLFVDRPLIQKALRYGVKGYVAKESIVKHLPWAVRRVEAGERYLCPIATQALQDGAIPIG